MGFFHGLFAAIDIIQIHQLWCFVHFGKLKHSVAQGVDLAQFIRKFHHWANFAAYQFFWRGFFCRVGKHHQHMEAHFFFGAVFILHNFRQTVLRAFVKAVHRAKCCVWVTARNAFWVAYAIANIAPRLFLRVRFDNFFEFTFAQNRKVLILAIVQLVVGSFNHAVNIIHCGLCFFERLAICLKITLYVSFHFVLIFASSFCCAKFIGLRKLRRHKIISALFLHSFALNCNRLVIFKQVAFVGT